MATEDQILQLHQREAALQYRINYCCRDIVIWKTYVRIVEEKTGIVVSDFFDNMATGHTRRGVPFTVYFSRPFDTSKFIMDRSISDRSSFRYTNFHIVTTSTDSRNGKTKNLEDSMVQMLNDFYEDSSASMINDYWPNSQYYHTTILRTLRNGSSFLPQTINERNNLYRVYKDPTDNKIKIDIMGKNQFYYSTDRVNGYDTLFVTQWVLKEGASL